MFCLDIKVFCHILILIQFQVNAEDGLPMAICESCVNKCIEWKLFKDQCERSVSVLKKCLAFTKSLTAVPTSIPVSTSTLSLASTSSSNSISTSTDSGANIDSSDNFSVVPPTPQPSLEIVDDIKPISKRFTTLRENARAPNKSSNQKLECESCGKTFKNETYFNLHKFSHESQQAELANSNNQRKKTHRQKRVNEQKRVCAVIPNNKNNFTCTECGQTSRNEWEFYKHQKRHEGFINFFCEICGRGFANSRQQEMHIITHV